MFWVLAAACAAGLLVISAIPDPAIRRPGWIASTRPTGYGAIVIVLAAISPVAVSRRLGDLRSAYRAGSGAAK